jgi:hypothetical protein
VEEIDVNTKDKSTARSSNKIAILQGFAFVFLSVFAGVICPLFTSMFRGPVGGDSWQAWLLTNLHWHWTVPLGVVLAVLTVWISNKLSQTARAVFGLVVSLVLLGFALLLTWLMLLA